MDNKEFKPYIPADKSIAELTPTAIITGALLAVLFSAANAYLGLRVGMTVSASIPAAVISMGIMRKILRRNSILENNMVQTIASAGESLAAGAIFTLPVLFMWSDSGSGAAPSFLEISLISLCGGLLGVFLMVPLRRALIVKEHGVLTYPEGTACAEVLAAGEKGGAKSSCVFSGLLVSALYKLFADGFKLFPSEIDFNTKAYKGSGFGLDVLPALAGVGYICGTRVSSYLFSGGVFAWLVIMPLIAAFGTDAVIYPSEVSVAELYMTSGAWGLWKNYVRYIGAGAVAAGGIISLVKTMPLIMRTFKEALGGFSGEREQGRTQRDLSDKTVLIGAAAVVAAVWLLPAIPVGAVGAVLIVVFGFFFAVVSSRMVGLIGSSNNPVSGMAIATLIVSSLVLKMTSNSAAAAMTASISVGSVICITAAMAGDTSQDLKTGYLLGATPIRQQVGELIGAVISAVTIGAVLYLLNRAWGYGSSELPAPQATLMKLVVEGVVEGSLPWGLVVCGAFAAIAVEILGIPVLPFSIGLYLPVHLSAPIMLGGLVRWFAGRRRNSEKAERAGTLYCSGLIAGEGLVGVLLAAAAAVPFDEKSLLDKINLSGYVNSGIWGSVVLFAVLLLSVVWACIYYSREKGKV